MYRANESQKNHLKKMAPAPIVLRNSRVRLNSENLPKCRTRKYKQPPCLHLEDFTTAGVDEDLLQILRTTWHLFPFLKDE